MTKFKLTDNQRLILLEDGVFNERNVDDKDLASLKRRGLVARRPGWKYQLSGDHYVTEAGKAAIAN